MNTYGIAILFGVAIVVLAVIQCYRLVVGFRKSTGTTWQRILAAFSYSHTILFARLAQFMAASSVWLVNFLPALDPTSPLGAATTALLQPQYAVWYAFAFALFVELVRRAPSAKSPITPPPQAVTIPAAPVAGTL